MEFKFIEFIQESLNDRRRNLSRWLIGIPDPERQARLGPAGEPAVQDHLHAIDVTIIACRMNKSSLL
jgi:hypothetical protein